MNAAPILLLSVIVATGASLAATYALRPDAKLVEVAESIQPDQLAALRKQVEDLQSELQVMRVESTETELPTAPRGDRFEVAAIDRAVERYLEEHLGEALAGKTLESADSSAAESTILSPEELSELILEKGLSEEQQIALWKRVRESGQLDEAIALLEERAEKFSDDPDAQVDVASAYLQKIFEVGDGPEAGIWANKADSAYDRALALDEQHWSARFNKAVSLSFWPPIFGKQGEAISNFEKLIGQQEMGGGVDDNFNQTYILLGNLYAQSGDTEKAEATWKKGLAMFPDNEALLAKFSNQ
ncbi:MAG: tetratricopeptide (TPR) repeat protein [Planctomycetota bacterium]|jgi:tetratricopeptide (TPR) repeat protein